jgi:hypothetical protein
VDLPAQVRVPVVLDLVVCPTRQVAGDQRPPEKIAYSKSESDANHLKISHIYSKSESDAP